MGGLKNEGTVVEARAPGKVIITGEHAVVHGTTAVAAALNRYTTVRVKRPHVAPSGIQALTLDMPELQVQLELSLEHIKQSLNLAHLGSKPLPNCHADDLKALLDEFLKKELPSHVDTGSRTGVAAFFFLYLSVLGLQPLEVMITSELPVGSGLGSSAAFCVAVTGALLAVVGNLNLNSKEDSGSWLDIEEKGQDLVNTIAFEGEKMIHGKPSGVDNTVSCYGHIVKFRKGSLTRLQKPVELRMLVTNTNVSRNTKALVAGVATRAERHPAAMRAVFDAVEAISDEVVSILEPSITSDDSSNVTNINEHHVTAQSESICTEKEAEPNPANTNKSASHTSLEELILMNQGLLQCMGVSHPSVEAICQITGRSRLCSKLTGAGGGGCVLTFIPNDTSRAIVHNLKSQLEITGYHCFEAGIGGPGLQICLHTDLGQDFNSHP